MRSYASGEVVFREGESCCGFFAIRAGGVKLYRATPDGREQVVHNLGAGQTFTEAALLNMGFYPAAAVATESPTELLEIEGERFLRLFREDSRLAAAMVGSLSIRPLSLVERVEELSLVNAGSRLARWLARQPSTGPKERPRVDLSMPKKDLAAHLSMTPETLSRLLRRWQDEGLRGKDIEADEAGVRLAPSDLVTDPIQAGRDGAEIGRIPIRRVPPELTSVRP